MGGYGIVWNDDLDLLFIDIRVAAYCRVSTEQEEQLGSFANQMEYYVT